MNLTENWMFRALNCMLIAIKLKCIIVEIYMTIS